MKTYHIEEQAQWQQKNPSCSAFEQRKQTSPGPTYDREPQDEYNSREDTKESGAHQSGSGGVTKNPFLYPAETECPYDKPRRRLVAHRLSPSELHECLSAQIREKSNRKQMVDQSSKTEPDGNIGEDGRQHQSSQRAKSLTIVRQIQQQQIADQERERQEAKRNIELERKLLESTQSATLETIAVNESEAREKIASFNRSIESQRIFKEEAYQSEIRTSAIEDEKILEYRRLVADRENAATAAKRLEQQKRSSIASTLASNIQLHSDKASRIEAIKETVREADDEEKNMKAIRDMAMRRQNFRNEMIASYDAYNIKVADQARCRVEDTLRARLEADAIHKASVDENRVIALAKKEQQRLYKEELDKTIEFKRR